jgi:glutathione S-transferase
MRIRLSGWCGNAMQDSCEARSCEARSCASWAKRDSTRLLGHRFYGTLAIDDLSFRNPVFVAYSLAASIMILKAQAMSWLTVWRMIRLRGGFRSPEDLRSTPLNRNPDPSQLAPDERVERIRRIHQNDLENLPFFLVAGLLFVLTNPPLVLAQWLFYGYVVSRMAHFAAYLTSQTHDVRAALWTVGSLILIYMAVRTLLAGLGY